jgi:hypothetical protein
MTRISLISALLVGALIPHHGGRDPQAGDLHRRQRGRSARRRAGVDRTDGEDSCVGGETVFSYKLGALPALGL